MGMLEGNSEISDNDWEAVKRGGDAAIEKWIDGQMVGRSCAVVLVGTKTSERRWVREEIAKAWNKGMGVVGIRIHGLSNKDGYTSSIGANPFDIVTLNGGKMSSKVTLYSPTGADSKAVYADIKAKIDGLVESAIAIRKNA